MEDEVLFERRGSLGIATLNMPRTLNALTETMVLLLFRQYSQWDADLSISTILLRGAGGRAFCAGGDVKAVTAAVAAGRPEAAFAFFRAEYRLDLLISRLSKPHVALLDGIVMGGGAGLSVHGRFRVATEATTFAMPECAIGLFPDVGTTFFLPRACGLAVARWVALTGARLRGREVVESGVGTHFVRRERLPELVEALAALPPPPPPSPPGSSSSSPSGHFAAFSSLLCACSSWMPSWLLPLLRRKKRCPVEAVLSEFEEKPTSPSASSSSFASLSRDVERLFGESCSSLEQLRGSVSREARSSLSSSSSSSSGSSSSSSAGAPGGWLRSAANALETECPQSQALSWALLEASTAPQAAGATAFSLADALRLEWRVLARVSLASPDSDFVEGVSARLLSKPSARAARWRGPGDERAAREVVARPLAPPLEREELELELEGGGGGGKSGGEGATAVQSRL